ncbi:MAG: hypothetical protein ACK5KN_04330 [Dysgonomonas sp.]|uniref:hypothetical protein n=1 Tax=Dysgonomonas sp. TaxID=1891233 RepID=UPI003A859D11
MAGEKTSVKYVVDGIDFATAAITQFEDIATAEWTPQPLTLRDDTVEIVEGDPEEDEIYSHENDAPEDYEITGTGITVSGSFIKATIPQLIEILGGTNSGTAFVKSAKKIMFEKTVRFRFKNGGYAVIPKGRGYALLNLNVGRDGRAKFPFVIKALAPDGWDCDIVLDLGT